MNIKDLTLEKLNLGFIPLLLILLTNQSCKPTLTTSNNNDDDKNSFELKSLKLEQQNELGEPYWRLLSPKAKYDLVNRLIKASSPIAKVYERGQPIFELKSNNLTVLNDGQFLIMDGKSQLEQIHTQKILIASSKVKWNTDNSKFTFTGPSTIKRWPPGYPTKENYNLILNSNDLVLELDTGKLNGTGPITASIYSINEPTTYITSGEIIGNTKDGYIELINCNLRKEGIIVTKSDACMLRWLTPYNSDITINSSNIKEPIRTFNSKNNINSIHFHSKGKQRVNSIIRIPHYNK